MSIRDRLLVMSLGAVLVASQSEIKGPPRADVKILKKIGHLGENIRLQCPIEGFPPPIYEWTKSGESIDFTWTRYKVNKKMLKIKSAELEDTGVYGCRGINGFGSDAVRIELIIVDPSLYPSNEEDGIIADLAPPVFTSETKNAPKIYRKSVGESFQLSCEALGSPDPRIEWLKDGQVANEPSKNVDGHGSILDLSFLSSSDSGTYTCRASNLLSQVDITFTLEVSGSSPYPPGNGLSTIVTEAGPRNGTVEQGSDANLFCRVKSLISPHVQWLKKLDAIDAPSDEQDSAFILKVAGDRFRMLPRDQIGSGSTEKVQSGEFLDRLILKNVVPQDSGMYICFVTSNGIGQLTYKAVYLNVMPIPGHSSTEFPSISPPTSNASSTTATAGVPSLPILVSVVCLAILFFCLSILSAVYVIRKKGGGGWTSKKGPGENGGQEKLESQQLPSTLPPNNHPHPMSCETRPFLMLSNSDKLGQSAAYYPTSQQLQQQQLIYSDAQPLSSIGSQWSSTVYPLSSFGQQQLIPSFQSKSVPLKPKNNNNKNSDFFHPRTDSRLKDFENQQPVSIRLNGEYEFPVQCVTSQNQFDRNNVYEVPYSHLFRSQFLPEDEWSDPRVTNPVNPAILIPKLRPQPLGGSTSMSNHSNSAHNKYQDYESCYE